MIDTSILPFSDSHEKRWKARLAFVGMYFEITHQSTEIFLGNKQDVVEGYIRRDGGGRASRGCGKSVGDAIRNAAIGQNIDWYAIDSKMTDQAWKSMAHL